MGVPTSLEEWTLDAVKELLAKGVFESDWFDFKVGLPHKDAKTDKIDLRKRIAAFANSEGGYLVYGVKDDRKLSPEKRLVGIDPAFDFPRHFGEYASGRDVAPSIEWTYRNPPIEIPETVRLIHVIWIYRSWRKPHVILEGVKMMFPKRTNKGTEYMDYSEVRLAFEDTERRRVKLGLLAAELSKVAVVAEEILFRIPPGDPQHGIPFQEAWTLRYNTTLIDTALGEVFTFLSAVPELWSDIQKMRTVADISNAACEAFATAVYFRSPGQTYLFKEHYQTIRDCADEILKATNSASKQLAELLA